MYPITRVSASKMTVASDLKKPVTAADGDDVRRFQELLEEDKDKRRIPKNRHNRYPQR